MTGASNVCPGRENDTLRRRVALVRYTGMGGTKGVRLRIRERSEVMIADTALGVTARICDHRVRRVKAMGFTVMLEFRHRKPRISFPYPYHHHSFVSKFQLPCFSSALPQLIVLYLRILGIMSVSVSLSALLPLLLLSPISKKWTSSAKSQRMSSRPSFAAPRMFLSYGLALARSVVLYIQSPSFAHTQTLSCTAIRRAPLFPLEPLSYRSLSISCLFPSTSSTPLLSTSPSLCIRYR
jgi:hypothetical protein